MTRTAQGHSNGHQHNHEDHGHHHPTGIRGFFHDLFVPHSHDAADSIDDALESSAQGIRAVKISLVGLGITALLQLAVVVISGSVALLADTIHNFSDALTAIPLWIAFILGRRKATRRYTFGYGRAEDLAGLFIVAMIALSALGAGWQSVDRLLNPQPLQNLGWVFAAGLVGFAGNELVAMYRIKVGRNIGSAALVADGIHARTDGFTSLAVVLGVIGVWLGFPLADPIVGLIITIAIVILLWGTARDIGRRLLDGIDPLLVDRAEAILLADDSVQGLPDVRLRWNGHRLNIAATVALDPVMTIEGYLRLQRRLEAGLHEGLPGVGYVSLTPIPAGRTGS
ncbi:MULTISPECIES: cation diffusion facilitator family transporter [Micrococcaceae]|jgi:cation diffusion facilitator family transporter|uniref:Predicted Co/Zn/Cd cation transporter n=3 Tax=Micrococcaceae TaxID=1268 RepID=Q6SK39_PAEAU|nr:MULTISPECIES: cation diffusion facilitator family transporter [Micrococcaceae]AAS20133.1 predicted Co/Zn/Cd cation transporter [Paenarthrobacter aurescens]ABM10461.1 putative cobalt-zinc-cadmium efflux permease [Paenarthrobacter aurescens TC1]SDQ03460.1 cation diffusion facilitator family transporter [Arthrobacter crystallopoietes]